MMLPFFNGDAAASSDGERISSGVAEVLFVLDLPMDLY
jgi:hypothetical protein